MRTAVVFVSPGAGHITNTTTALGRLDLLKETAERAPVGPRGPDALEPRLRDTLAAAGAHEEVIAGIAPVAAGAEEDL